MDLERRPLHSSLIDRVNVVNRREGDLVEAFVPINLIYREDVPVDEEHVRELAAAFKVEAKYGLGSGQLSAVLLGEVEGFDQFPIIDGFHRIASLNLNNEETVFATIKRNITPEEIIDLRILSAATHKSIRFSRLIEWVESAWSISPWAERIKVRQAFALRSSTSTSMAGERMGLNSEEIEDVKSWVDKKCDQWHMSSGYLYQHLTTAQIAAPDLVKEARERKGGRRLDAITPQHLREISITFPNSYDFQRLIARTAKDQALTVRETRVLAISLINATDLADASRIIREDAWKAPRQEFQAPGQLFEAEQGWEIPQDPKLLEKFFSAEIKIAELTIENARLNGRYNPNQKSSIKKASAEIEPKTEEVPPTITLNDTQTNDIVIRMYEELPKVQRALNRRFGISADESEDILSEVILRTLTAIKKGRFSDRGNNSLASWTLKLAGNEAINRHRKNKNIRSLDEPSADNTLTLVERLEDESAEKEFEQVDQDYFGTLRACLPHVSEEQRRAFVLREFFQLPYFDIAQILGKTVVNVKVQVFKARAKIGSLIIEEGIIR